MLKDMESLSLKGEEVRIFPWEQNFPNVTDTRPPMSMAITGGFGQVCSLPAEKVWRRKDIPFPSKALWAQGTEWDIAMVGKKISVPGLGKGEREPQVEPHCWYRHTWSPHKRYLRMRGS